MSENDIQLRRGAMATEILAAIISTRYKLEDPTRGPDAAALMNPVKTAVEWADKLLKELKR